MIVLTSARLADRSRTWTLSLYCNCLPTLGTEQADVIEPVEERSAAARKGGGKGQDWKLMTGVALQPCQAKTCSCPVEHTESPDVEQLYLSSLIEPKPLSFLQEASSTQRRKSREHNR